MLLTTSQVAERLGVSTKTVYRWAADGHLTAFKVLGEGRALRFEQDQVERLAADRVREVAS